MTPRMKPDEARKLLGGYATGTLTEPERDALFAAALEDQSLFDALAEEDALRELLETPGAKTRLLAAVGEKPAAYWFGLPWLTRARALSFGGLAAMVALTVGFLAQKPALLPERPREVSEVAPVTKPEPPVLSRDARRPQAKDRARAESKPAPAGLSRQADPAKDLKKETEADQAVREETVREKANEKAKESGRPDLKATEPEVRKADLPRSTPPPTPPPPASAPVAGPPAAPKLADTRTRPENSNLAVRGAQDSASAGFRAVPSPMVQQRPTPSQQQQASAPVTSQQAASQPITSQQQSGTIKRQQDAAASKSAGGAPAPAGEQSSQDKLASGRDNKVSSRKTVSGERLTMRYRLQQAEGGDAPPELTVETSTGFVYILRRTGSGWDTVASGNGPHVLPDAGEYAVVASRAELANPASAIRATPTDRNLVTLSGNGFTSVSSPESSVAATLRVRAR